METQEGTEEAQETQETQPAPAAAEPLEQARTTLSHLLRPYKSELRRRERITKHLEQYLRAVRRDDFFQIAELLQHKDARAASEDPDLEGIEPLLQDLRAHAEARIDAYRLQFLADLEALAEEAGLALKLDFPHLSLREGIDGTIDFAARKTTLNATVLKSVDPRRIVAQLGRLDRRLYGRPFDPTAFVEGLLSTYRAMLAEAKERIGTPVPIRDFYLRHVLSLQSKTFAQNIERRRFRGYPLDEFSVDLWRLFSSEVQQTSDGHVLALRPGRSQSLWLLDRQGERRQISSIAFRSMG